MADLNTSFSATGNLTASDPLSISTGTVKLTVNDPVKTGVITIGTGSSDTETILAKASQLTDDYWVYLRNTSATAIDVLVKGNLKREDGDSSWTGGGTHSDVPFMQLKQHDWCWYPVCGSNVSGITASEGRGVTLTNLSSSANATVEYGLYKKN